MIDYTKLITADMKSAKAVQDAIDVVNTTAQAYLASTDWMVLRQADSGEAMPNSIKDARAAARLEIKP